MNRKTGALLGAAALVAGAFGLAAPASAQATRTWVSGVGDDFNPCSRTAPCRTLGAALSKTAAGGEINCLDPATFGLFTINKSVSILCDDVPGGMNIEFDDTDQWAAIVVNIGPTDTVVLSGLNIHGNLRAGQSGIRIESGGAVHVRNSTMASLGDCAITTLDATEVVIDNLTSIDNFCGASFLKDSAGQLDFALTNSRIAFSTRTGIYVGGSASMGVVKGIVSDTVIDETISPSWGVRNHGIVVDGAQQPVGLAVEDSIVSGHRIGAFEVSGSGAIVTVSGTAIVNNGVAIKALNGASVISYRDNVLAGNMSNGAFTGVSTKK